VSRIDLRVFPDLQSLSAAAAAELAATITNVVRERGQFSIALAGGNTPKALYECLGSRFATSVPWNAVHFYWGDERYVPYDDPRSNYKLAKDSLLDRINIPPGNIHGIPTHYPDPSDAAWEYESILPARFDLVLLGMGADGHTASLFPGSPALQENNRRVINVRATAEPPIRITLSMPVLLEATSVHFLISGKDKATALKKATSPETPENEIPTAKVFRSARKVICWADEAAMKEVGRTN